jgi:hypothetical protein
MTDSCTRRDFLRLSACAVCAAMTAAIVPMRLSSCQPAAAAKADSQYYVSRKDKILQDWNSLTPHLHAAIKAHHGADIADAVIRDARPQLDSLLAQLPYIGGNANELTTNLTQSAGALALYRSMKARGKTAREVGLVLYEGYDAYLSTTSKVVTTGLGVLQALGLDAQKARQDVAESKKHAYPGDWVQEFVEGDGKTFDWGIDYTECGIVKFFHAQGADELAPYLCQLDYPMSRVFGMGLVRTTTLAQGGTRCDFRYKRGRKTEPGWPPAWERKG